MFFKKWVETYNSAGWAKSLFDILIQNVCTKKEEKNNYNFGQTDVSRLYKK